MMPGSVSLTPQNAADSFGWEHSPRTWNRELKYRESRRSHMGRGGREVRMSSKVMLASKPNTELTSGGSGAQLAPLPFGTSGGGMLPVGERCSRTSLISSRIESQ